MARRDYIDDPNAPIANSIAVAVSAFVTDQDGQLLMIRRSDNELYSIPGGQLELGETLSAAIVREVLEETGVEISVSGLVGLYSNPRHVIAYDDGEVRQEFSICFRGSPITGYPRGSVESTDARWVRSDEIPSLSIHPSTLLRINHGYANSPMPYFT